jgi:hypothetical protein
MSKVKIEGNASGTGTLTIAAPNTNTDRTLTLPDAAGEILTDTTGLTSSSSLNAANLTGTLPAIDGSALTGVGGGAWEIVEAWTPTAVNSKDFDLDHSTYSEFRVDITGIILADATSVGNGTGILSMSFLADSGTTANDNIAYLSRANITTTTYASTATATTLPLVTLYGYPSIGGGTLYTTGEGTVTFKSIETISLSTYAPYDGARSSTFGKAITSSTLSTTTDEVPFLDHYFSARGNATATDPRFDTLRLALGHSGFRASQGAITLYGLKRS